MKIGKILVSAGLVCLSLTACGTTYELPQIGDAENQRASLMFAAAKQEPARAALSERAAAARFQRVAGRVAPIAESACRQAMAKRAGFDCQVGLAIDREMKERNAYFTYDKAQKPIIRLSMPLLRDTRSDDEVAFVMSHEYGHLIGRHVEKQKQQALAGAIILGALTAAATTRSTAYGSYYDGNAVRSSMELGAAAGSVAFSQSYELESDTLGTRIAHAAGYDPLEGAKFFARPEKARTSAGNLSFWGTHPPDAKRVATVIATVEQIEARVALKSAPGNRAAVAAEE
ncbi:M48 family metalloprotease [Aquicoccus sp. SCR17]|nr:M48 family metalloprotease [Carideicomes alvinocaridis]